MALGRPGDRRAFYGHTENNRSDGDGHLVLEDLEEPRHLLVGVVMAQSLAQLIEEITVDAHG